MAIQTETKKEKKDLKIVFIVLGFILLFLLWKFLFTGGDMDIPIISVTKEIPRIDFIYLESPEFRQFYVPESIQPLVPGTMGRNNPFLPYR